MNRRETRQTLSELGLRAEKGLGQNFLVNPLAAGRIVRALGCEPVSVLEIGPGLGALTEALLAAGHRVSTVELSLELALRMKNEYPGVHTVHGDFLEENPSLIPGFPFQAVASNLPYNISSQAVLRFCEPVYSDLQRAVVMLQKEMAERLCCIGGGRNYGRLSLMVWPWFSLKKLFDLSPEEFMPRPRVDSRVVVLERRADPPLTREQYSVYGRIVKAAFSSRRKKVINCLTSVFGREIAGEMLNAASIDPDLRAERIPPEKFVKLAVGAIN
jgi:16S rRNA (adenine1518-N6/adenine1519-N6)-dimethyltransferase